MIARGTRPDGVCAAGALRDLAQLAHGLPQPALIVVGDVVVALPAGAAPAAA